MKYVVQFKLISFVLPVLLAFGLSFSLMVSLSQAQVEVIEAEAETPIVSDVELALDAAMPITTDFRFVDDINYARIITDNAVPVYSHPLDISYGIPPTRTIEPGFMFVSLHQKEPIVAETGQWYQINPDEFVQADVITYYTASSFHGAPITSQPQYPFGWVIRDTPIFSAPVDAATPRDIVGWPQPYKLAQENSSFIPRYTPVTIYETSELGDWGWRRIGENQWIHLYDVGRVDIRTRPAEIPAGSKWVAVNLFEQTMAAYNEQDEMIYATLISSGRQVEGWRTPPGIFKIYSKVKMAKMSGGSISDRYFLEDVTATMYFHDAYAFHAAYWHDDFGRYKSHGCINMTPTDAEWMFNWSTPVASPLLNKTRASEENDGTWVWVYDPYDEDDESEAETAEVVQ